VTCTHCKSNGYGPGFRVNLETDHASKKDWGGVGREFDEEKNHAWQKTWKRFRAKQKS